MIDQVETNPMDSWNAPLESQELIDSYLGRAGLLANAIMMGLVEPDVEVSPDVLLALADEMILRVAALDPDDMRFASRAVRAVKWACRADVQPEIALLFYGRAYGALSIAAKAEAEDATDDAKPVLSAMKDFADRFNGTGLDEFVFPNASA